MRHHAGTVGADPEDSGRGILPPCRSLSVDSRTLFAALPTILLTAAGCALGPLPNASTLTFGISDDDRGSAVLPESDTPFTDFSGPQVSRPEPRTISLELIVLGFDGHEKVDASTIERAIWAITDEQAIEPHARTQLSANGLRAGLISTPLPEWFEKDLSKLILTPDGSARDGSGLPAVQRTLRLLPGRESQLIARTDLEKLVVFESRNGGLSGRTFHTASTALDLRAWPAADGRVRLRAVPMIRHGPQRRDWVGDDGAFRLETGQAACLFEDLAVDLQIPEDMMLLVGCGSPVATASVGDAIFNDVKRLEAVTSTESSSLSSRIAAGTRKAFLIRPLARPIDPMFDASPSMSSDESRPPSTGPSGLSGAIRGEPAARTGGNGLNGPFRHPVTSVPLADESLRNLRNH